MVIERLSLALLFLTNEEGLGTIATTLEVALVTVLVVAFPLVVVHVSI